jgi:hypothetical protein
MRASWSQLAERGVSGHRLRAFARHHAVPPVRCCLFVDAALPARARHTPAAPTELLDFLRGKMTDGRLPPWTAWGDEDVAPLFPDAATRAAVTAEELRLPFAYYEQSVPVPAGWDDDVACDNLLFRSAIRRYGGRRSQPRLACRGACRTAPSPARRPRGHR